MGPTVLSAPTLAVRGQGAQHADTSALRVHAHCTARTHAYMHCTCIPSLDMRHAQLGHGSSILQGSVE